MRIDPVTGLLDAARYQPSPNGDDRPPGTIADLIVIHGISLPPGQFGGSWIDALFTDRLDPGEAAALVLAIALHADLLLVDDLAARRRESIGEGLAVLPRQEAVLEADVEVDPTAYALGGHSLHAGIARGHWRVDLGNFAMDLPAFAHADDGVAVSFDGFGAKRIGQSRLSRPAPEPVRRR